MKREFSGIWLILVTAMLFSIASFAVANDPDTNAFPGDAAIGPDTIKFVDPWQYTSKNVDSFEPPPVKEFTVGQPLWMNLFINIDKPMTVTAFYILKGTTTKVFKADFNLSKAGNWRISYGWSGGVPAELKGTWKLIGLVKSGEDKAFCSKPWQFTVK